MFIISKRNFLIQRPGSEPYLIRKDFVGELPADVASHWMVQAAIASGAIATPQGHKDQQLEQANEEAGKKADEADNRPDAGTADETAGKKAAKK